MRNTPIVTFINKLDRPSQDPFDLMTERVAANRAKDTEAMRDIEQRALERNAAHTDWICDEKLMEITREGRGLYMHCLPADIGAEVSAPVMEQFRVDLAREANKKVYAIMALLAAAKSHDLAAALMRAAAS